MAVAVGLQSDAVHALHAVEKHVVAKRLCGVVCARRTHIGALTQVDIRTTFVFGGEGDEEAALLGRVVRIVSE